MYKLTIQFTNGNKIEKEISEDKLRTALKEKRLEGRSLKSGISFAHVYTPSGAKKDLLNVLTTG